MTAAAVRRGRESNMKRQTGDFFHEVTTERKPWTHLNFGDRGGGADFCFGVMGDRTGRPMEGVFEHAIGIFNRMRPDFVLSVGDFIEGWRMEDKSAALLNRQWRKIRSAIERSVPPFFYVAGNHDYRPEETGTPHSRIWNRMFGVSYYFFIYKRTLFICLNDSFRNSGLGAEQTAWALRVLAEHADVRWTFVFVHSPDIWDSPDFAELEAAMYERDHTVFSGHKHCYVKYVRNGRKYFMLGMTGCGEVRAGRMARGVPFGEFDQVMWVSMCGGRPEFTPLAVDGIYDENVVTTEKITRLTSDYFRGNKKIPHREAVRLRAMGLDIEETEF